jgi:hypothetical protein
MRARPLGAHEAAELSEVLEYTAEILEEEGTTYHAATGDLCELRSELLSWAIRLLDTPAEAGSE